MLAPPGSEPNTTERRHRLAPLDSSAHAGVSLVGLLGVLTALGEFDAQARTRPT